MSQRERKGVALNAGRRVIRQEAEALLALAESLGEPFSLAVDALEELESGTRRGRVITAGVGKSGHVARKIAATLASTGAPSLYLHPTEASHGDLGMVMQGDVVIALSKSGETQELGDLIAYCNRFEIPLVAITAGPDSTLARAANVVLALPPFEEACAQTSAPTTSTTLMMALGDALAVALLERKGFTADHFKTFHPGGRLGAMLRRVGDLMHVGGAVPVCATGTPMKEALEVMSAGGFGCLGVLEPLGTLIGIVTDGDIRRLVAQGRMAMVIDDAMTRSPITVTPDLLASSALKLMNERKITVLMVVQGDVPVGIVHMHDFLKAGVA